MHTNIAYPPVGEADGVHYTIIGKYIKVGAAQVHAGITLRG